MPDTKATKKFPVPISDQRKIIRIGTTHYVSVPEEWLQFHGIKVGDYVYIIADSEFRMLPLTKELAEKLHRDQEKKSKEI